MTAPVFSDLSWEIPPKTGPERLKHLAKLLLEGKVQLDPEPQTLNPKPFNLNPNLSTLNPES